MPLDKAANPGKHLFPPYVHFGPTEAQELHVLDHIIIAIAIKYKKLYSSQAQIIVDWIAMHLTEESERVWLGVVGELFARIDGFGQARLGELLVLGYYQHGALFSVECPQGSEVFFPPKFTSLYNKEGSRETSYALVYTADHVITLRRTKGGLNLTVRETGARSAARTFAGV